MIVLSNSVFASYLNSSNTLFCYDFESDATDFYGNNDGVIVGNPTYTAGKSGNMIHLDGNDYINTTVTGGEINKNTNFTYIGYYYIDNWYNGVGNNDNMFGYYDGGNRVEITQIQDNDFRSHIGDGAGTIYTETNDNNADDNMYIMVTYRYFIDSGGTSNLTTCYNSTCFSSSGAVTEFTNSNYYIYIGASHRSPLQAIDGKMDTAFMTTQYLSNDNITDIYNSGTGFNCSQLNQSYTPPPTNPYQYVKIINRYNGSNIEGVNVTLNNSLWNLTQSDGIAYFENVSGNHTFTATITNYFDVSGLAVENQTVTYNTSQSQINFSCIEKITNTTLTCINGTIYPNANDYNFTINVTGYYPVTQSATITALDNYTINVTGFYSSNITLINNFIGGIGNDTTQCNYTIQTGAYTENVIGPNGTNAGLINGTYNLTADCDNYAYSNQTLLVNASVHNVTFDLYPSNSIDIYIYDETSGISLNGTNITVTRILGANQTVNYTSTGTISYQNLTAGNYTFSFYGDDYPSRSYAVEIGNKTYQTLNVYLLANSTDAVIFTFEEYNSNAIIEGVTFQISKVINGTDTILTVLTSDITGRVQFYFDTIERYCFVASKTSYTTKEFCLNPIIFNAYTIKLQSSVNLSTGDDYEGLLIDYISPFRYWNNQNNTVTFSFASPKGDLTNYGYNATYGATTLTKTGTNAYGSILTGQLEILGAQYGDKVTVYHWYKKSSDTEYHTFKSIYDIYGYNATSQSLTDNPPSDYGLGEFEKSLFSVIITLLVAGAGALFGGAMAGGLLGVFMFGWLMYVGFLNFWVGAISLILLFVTVAWGGTK